MNEATAGGSGMSMGGPTPTGGAPFGEESKIDETMNKTALGERRIDNS